MRIVLFSPADPYLADLLAELDGVDPRVVGSVDELAAELPAAEGMVMLGHLYTAPVAALVRERAARLRWIQLTTAGYDGVTFHGVPDTIAVTNAGHSHAPMVAEHALTLLTALTRRLHSFAARQAVHAFDRAVPLPPTTLEDATVAVLGFGGIGREIALRLRAFRSRVIAVARTPRHDDLADRVVGAEGLLGALAESDALVVACALTPQTRGMIDAAALMALRPGGLLVNIARGGIVDTDALMAALRGGHLAGAGLDVTDPEPPPADHPLWTCPNVIITPHISGVGSAAVRRRIADVVRENVGRFQADQPLVHRVA